MLLLHEMPVSGHLPTRYQEQNSIFRFTLYLDYFVLVIVIQYKH